MVYSGNRKLTSRPHQGGASLGDAPDFLTVAELREILRIGRKQAYALVKSGRIGSCRLGGSIRIPRVAVERLLDASGAVGPRGRA